MKFETAIKEIFEKYYYEEDVEQALQRRKEYGKTVIFGAGQLGHKVYHILDDRGEKVALFCDNKLCGRIDEDTGIEIVSLDRLEQDKKDIFVLIAVFEPSIYEIVYHQLSEFGFAKEQMMNAKNMAERYPISYLEKNVEQYKKVYPLLQDDFSKETYLAMIQKAYLDTDISKIAFREQDEYFDKAVVLTDEEVFVDCGGYIGDTAIRFIDRVKGRYKKLIILEPEADKEKLIKKNLEGYAYDLYTCGAWSSSTVLRFLARGDSTSTVSHMGQIEIKVKALDDLVIEDQPTFIKMDIEGAEIEALRGCKKIIQRYKPKLAICIYHKPEDLFTIPLLIKEMRDDYKLLIRQYGNSRFETVCYAI